MGITPSSALATAFGPLNTWFNGNVKREVVEMTFMDFAGNTETVSFRMNNTIASFVAAAFLSGAVASLDDFIAASSAELVGFKLSTEIVDTTVDVSAIDPESNVREMGEYFFTTGAGKETSIRVPSIKDSLILPGGGGFIDLSAPLSQRVIDTFAGAPPAGGWWLSRNQTMVNATGGKRVTYRRKTDKRH